MARKRNNRNGGIQTEAKVEQHSELELETVEPFVTPIFDENGQEVQSDEPDDYVDDSEEDVKTPKVPEFDEVVDLEKEPLVTEEVKEQVAETKPDFVQTQIDSSAMARIKRMMDK